MRDAASTERWEVTIATLVRDWDAVASTSPPDDPANWDAMFADIHLEQGGLVRNGLWLSGPSDLLSVLGRRGDELSHSAMIAWLVEPTGRHGLGSRLLDMIVAVAWPDEPRPTGPVLVRREVEKQSAVTGDQARADVVVEIGDSILVIENKVWAQEGLQQGERLYRAWVDEASDVRWLLLTPNGAAPLTVVSPEARDAWRSISYATFAKFLDQALLGSAEAPDRIGRQAAIQYLATVTSAFGLSTPNDAFRSLS